VRVVNRLFQERNLLYQRLLPSTAERVKEFECYLKTLPGGKFDPKAAEAALENIGKVLKKELKAIPNVSLQYLVRRGISEDELRRLMVNQTERHLREIIASSAIEQGIKDQLLKHIYVALPTNLITLQKGMVISAVPETIFDYLLPKSSQYLKELELLSKSFPDSVSRLKQTKKLLREMERALLVELRTCWKKLDPTTLKALGLTDQEIKSLRVLAFFGGKGLLKRCMSKELELTLLVNFHRHMTQRLAICGMSSRQFRHTQKTVSKMIAKVRKRRGLNSRLPKNVVKELAKTPRSRRSTSPSQGLNNNISQSAKAPANCSTTVQASSHAQTLRVSNLNSSCTFGPLLGKNRELRDKLISFLGGGSTVVKKNGIFGSYKV
jgi:hypothetical protein